MWRQLAPAQCARRVEDIDLDELRRQGIRGLLVDLDNTLTPWRGYEMTPACREWLSRAGREFRVCLLSNALRPQRVRSIAESLGVPYVQGLGPWGKPWRNAYRRALKQTGTAPGETAMIGDQLLVDVLGARRCGVLPILVQPIASREFLGTRLTRRLARHLERVLRRRGLWPEEEPSAPGGGGKASEAGEEVQA